MADLPADDVRLAAKDTLDRCHDKPVAHREDLFAHPKERQSGLLGGRCDARPPISPGTILRCMRLSDSPWGLGWEKFHAENANHPDLSANLSHGPDLPWPNAPRDWIAFRPILDPGRDRRLSPPGRGATATNTPGNMAEGSEPGSGSRKALRMPGRRTPRSPTGRGAHPGSRIHLTSPACRQKCIRCQANPWQGGLDSYARTRRQTL